MIKPIPNLIFNELSAEVLAKIAPNGVWESRKWNAHRDLRARIDQMELGEFILLPEKIWALRYKQPIRPKCVMCGAKVRFRDPIVGFASTCSTKCGANKPSTKAKTAATLLERFGGHHTQNKEWIDEFVEHCHEAGSYEKGMKTFEERYGVSNVFQLQSTKDAIKETNLERYGVENPQQNETIKAKTAATVLEKYGGAYHPEKVKKTNLEKYGVENPMSNPEIAAKSVQTRIDKYGAPWNPEQVKKTNMKLYGVECVLSNSEVRQKGIETNILRYGFPNAMQNPDIFKKAIHNRKRTKQFTLPSGKVIDLQGYEPQVLTYIFICKLFTEEELVFPVPRITRPEGAIYTPDLWIPKENLLIEVKSTYTWFHEKHAALARRKAQAAKDAGYRIEVWVWDDKVKLPTIITDFTD